MTYSINEATRSFGYYWLCINQGICTVYLMVAITAIVSKHKNVYLPQQER